MMAPITESQKTAMLKYAKAHVKRIPLDYKRDEYEHIAEHAKQQGKPLNTWIKSAIQGQIKRDNSPALPEITPDEWRSLQMALHIASAHGYNPPTLNSINEKLTEITGEAPAPTDPPKRKRGRPRIQ